MMKVKVGNVWYEATKEAPICVWLDQIDRIRIEGMSENLQKYALFTEDTEMTEQERIEWCNK